MNLFQKQSHLICAAFSFFFTSTKLVSWRDPNSTVDANKLKKVWVMCLVKDEPPAA
jgi:hypothetical protein